MSRLVLEYNLEMPFSLSTPPSSLLPVVSDSFCGPVSVAQHLPHQAPFPTEPSTVAGLFRGTTDRLPNPKYGPQNMSHSCCQMQQPAPAACPGTFCSFIMM